MSKSSSSPYDPVNLSTPVEAGRARVDKRVSVVLLGGAVEKEQALVTFPADYNFMNQIKMLKSEQDSRTGVNQKKKTF